MDRGRGYCPSEMNKREDQPAGSIPVDSLFSPIERVRYDVGTDRVGERTDYDSLTLEVWTDGTIEVDEALSSAATCLIDHLRFFTELAETGNTISFKSVEEIGEKDTKLTIAIEELDFSVRTYNCLKRAAINSIADLVVRTEDEMIKVRNLGKKSLDEVKEKLAEMDLHLKDKED